MEYGSINFWLRIKDKNLDDEEIKKLIENEKKNNINIDVKLGSLLCGCKISPDMFDERGNRNSGWGKGEKRGPPDYLVDYIPPEGWYGYGLKVWDVYENNTWLGYTNEEGEWYIAYHGTSGKVAPNILNEGFKRGDGHLYNDNDNINELTKQSIKKVGKGVYCHQILKLLKDMVKELHLEENLISLFLCVE